MLIIIRSGFHSSVFTLYLHVGVSYQLLIGRVVSSYKSCQSYKSYENQGSEIALQPSLCPNRLSSTPVDDIEKPDKMKCKTTALKCH